ncbi:MAG: acetoacetate decarboxylase family protein [Gammaproteobacteria bacterium]|nr:acetoacetate decarboxylase family protein [Gammaproteobacteria bacterium]
MQQGFFFPRTPSGQASIVPPPPWYYSGDLLILEYRTDPAAIAGLLPEGIELADDDPGAVAAIWADWQSCGGSFEELLDPIRAQYKEVFFVVRCKYRGVHYSRCVYIWVDKDFALVRGYHQGYPKKLGSIHLTRHFPVGRAAPRLEAGGKFGATLSAGDRRLANAVFEITGPSDDAGFVNAHPMLHNRWVPRIESDGEESLSEVVTMSGVDADIGLTFKGDFSLELLESPTEELVRIAPQENICGYWRQVGVSWAGGETLSRQSLDNIE